MTLLIPEAPTTPTTTTPTPPTMTTPTTASTAARVLFHLCRVFVGVILIGTGVGKGLDIPGFVGVIGTYDLMPGLLHWPTALGMTTLEVVLGTWLLSNRQASRAGLVSAVLHLSFTIWACIALLRGLDIPNCGCFGVFFARPLTWGTPIEDGVMIAVSLVVFFLGRAHKRSPR